MRALFLSRGEAENLVDLLERHGTDQQDMFSLAVEVRELFGMSPYPAGTVRPREAVEGDI